MKVYDKEIYNKQESIRTIVIFILVFLLGFFAGYMAHSFNETHSQEHTNNTYVIENKLVWFLIHNEGTFFSVSFFVAQKNYIEYLQGCIIKLKGEDEYEKI